MTLDEAQARIAMLYEALIVSRFELPLLCMAGSSETLHEREREMMRRFNAALAATAEQVAAWRASVESAARARAGESLVHICATYGIKVSVREDGTHIESADPLRERLAEARAKALEPLLGIQPHQHCESCAAFVRALAAEPTPNDALSERIADAMERSKPRVAEALKLGRSMAGAEDPHSPFYRVGQTGVERALPVADAMPLSREWCECAAKREAGREVGAGAPAVCGIEFSPFGLPAKSFIKSAKCTLPTGHLGHHKWTASLNPTGPPTTLDSAPAAKPEVCATDCAKVVSGEREAPCMYACERDTGRAR